MSKGIQAIQAERDSQPARGFTPRLDATYTNNQLVDAAEAYIYCATGDEDLGRQAWPWNQDLLHLNTSSSSLAKAGAMIAAEIDRRFAAGECHDTDFGHPFPEEEPKRRKFE